MPLDQCQSDLYHPSFPKRSTGTQLRPNANDPISITSLCLIVTGCSGWWQQMPNTEWLFFMYMHRTHGNIKGSEPAPEKGSKSKNNWCNSLWYYYYYYWHKLLPGRWYERFESLYRMILSSGSLLCDEQLVSSSRRQASACVLESDIELSQSICPMVCLRCSLTIHEPQGIDYWFVCVRGHGCNLLCLFNADANNPGANANANSCQQWWKSKQRCIDKWSTSGGGRWWERIGTSSTRQQYVAIGGRRKQSGINSSRRSIPASIPWWRR